MQYARSKLPSAKGSSRMSAMTSAGWARSTVTSSEAPSACNPATYAGSANAVPLIRWNVDGVLYPAAAYWDLYCRPDLVHQALSSG